VVPSHSILFENEKHYSHHMGITQPSVTTGFLSASSTNHILKIFMKKFHLSE
jgi:hypothetical protein